MKTEVCIVGGGLVGLSAAIAFARQGREVILLEASDLKPEVPAELDARSIALSYSTIQIFRALELWPELQQNVAPITNIHVSSAGHFGVTRLKAEDCQLDAMGYVIEYHLLIQLLLNVAENEKNIQIITPARVETVEQADDAVKLQYLSANETSTLNTLLLVVADGANSSVREKLGISIETRDYQQTAVIANIKINQPSSDFAFERFTNNGPLALLPLPEQRYSMVWTNTPARAEALAQLSDEKFIQQVYRQFGYRLGLLDSVGTRVRFDLKLTRANQLAAGRAVLIGNAANTLHPVAGQGFNLALRDIGVLFDLLSGVNLQTDVVQSQLDVYQLQRVEDQHQAVNYGDRLVQLFSNNLPVLNHLRAGALAVLDLCPMMKKEVSWQGMGYGPGCSSLMRGVR
ncbi:MAG: 2-octaprenyl-6-methoxyphenyl hydroxylase [Gammaproteobacteria bacterium]|nr:2-octaprenyl-6-methoxyphenyl hydroxylase [Gammaproteobacteria bacterium]